MKREIPNNIVFEWPLGFCGTVSFYDNKITIQTNEPFGKTVGDMLRSYGFHQRRPEPTVYIASYSPIRHVAMKRMFA